MMMNLIMSMMRIMLTTMVMKMIRTFMKTIMILTIIKIAKYVAADDDVEEDYFKIMKVIQ